jgi:hypothetical protein
MLLEGQFKEVVELIRKARIDALKSSYLFSSLAEVCG